MSVYIIHPSLTHGNNPIAEKFYEVFQKEICEHVPCMEFRNEMTLGGRPTIGKDDAVVFFNRNDQNYSRPFERLLNEAVQNESLVYPVAMSRDDRRPPEVVYKVQTFDVIDHLRRRGLTEANITTIAIALARKVISDLQPTLAIDNMHLFLSHRRVDGEEIAYKFSDALQSRVASHFRDIIHVHVGKDAQEVIERNLKRSDAVIFLDTPLAAESEWVAKELRLALSYNIPIVWIRFGVDDGNRKKLPVLPAGIPHFELLNFDPLSDDFDLGFIDSVMQMAFRIIRRNSATVFDQIDTLKEIAANQGMQLTPLDSRNMIFEIRIPRRGYKYKQIPMTHLVQIFGRAPKEDDLEAIPQTVCDLGYEPHHRLGQIVDSTLMLAPTSARERIGSGNDLCVVDSFDEYLSSLRSLEQPMNTGRPRKKGIIISGAFPDCEPEHQQNLTDAIFSFTQAIFDRGGIVIFGAHPTFQHLIFDMGKRIRPTDYKQAIHLYCSRLFVTPPLIEEFEAKATVIPTDIVDNSREKSLTLMRTAMVSDQEAVALISLGGKTDAIGHSPGVDEEIRMARESSLPAFLIGSVGGRTAQLASELNADGWRENKFNDLSVEENQELLVSLDFRVMANKILDRLGF